MSIVDWIYPKICVGCGREGQYICRECAKQLVKPPDICPMCCKPSPSGWVHYGCRKPRGLDRLSVGLPYQGLVQKTLKLVKYKSAWDILGELFIYWAKGGGELAFDATQIYITSVPMYRVKERGRGFNQAELFAKLLAEYLSGVSRKVEYGETLVRVRQTRPMFGLSKKERGENVKGAFRPIGNLEIGNLQDKIIILSDDVWTTGSTMRECAKVLKLAGATRVWAVTLAR